MTINNNPINERKLRVLLQEKIDSKTKPLGSLGQLEELAFQIGLAQSSLTPNLKSPRLFVFAGDHGVASAGVSAYPSEVTYQMVLNFLNGGAAINVFCRQHNLDLNIVDAGVNGELPDHSSLIKKKVGACTKNFLHTPAMSTQECYTALHHGKDIITEKDNSSIYCFGEMGIGNTSAASAIMSLICNIPVDQCVGKGTGLSQIQLDNKIKVLKESIAKHSIDSNDPIEVLSTFGGFEIAMMAGAMLAAAQSRKLIVIDGFISSAAFLVAYTMDSSIMPYAIFSHVSDEHGHMKLLQFLKAKPLLNLSLRLGEGTGCALAFPIIQAAVNFLNEMASFESASVSKES